MATLEENVRQANSDFNAIKAKIIESGIEIAEGTKTEEYATKVGKVYDKGRQDENNAFWDNITNYGNRMSYSTAFAQWSNEYIRPNRKIAPPGSTSGNSTFNACPNLKKIEAEYFDFSQKATGTSSSSGWYYTFYNCPELEEIEDIGLTAAQYGYTYTFANCKKLHTIGAVRTDENTLFSHTFDFCNLLVNLNVIGTIAKNGIDMHWSTKLSKASITSIINALSPTTSGLTVTLSQTAVNNAFTTEEWNALIATKTNWTISLV